MSNENDLNRVKEIINEIEEKSADGGCIYRGERQCNDKVSSTLYRDFKYVDSDKFDIEVVQKEMLNNAKKHTGHLPHTGDLRRDFRPGIARMFSVREEDTAEAVDFDLLTEIQHYGGKTNLIDFTTDYLVALFFACDGHHDKDGRVIIQKTEEIQEMIRFPRNPRHRVTGQKSVFVRSPNGYIEPNEDSKVIIPASLKKLILQHLRNYHGIFTETIYNDVNGFIRSQGIHGDAYTHFYRGFACHKKADEATTTEVKQQEYDIAIKHYTESLKYKPDKAETYTNRGSAYNRIDMFQEAIDDYNKAIELMPNLPEAYIFRGVAYTGKGEYDNAIEDHNKAIELNPNHVAAIFNRGYTYYKLGDYNRAIADYDKAIEIQPDKAETYYNRGEVWLHLKELERAKSDLTYAKNKGMDIVAAFHNDYESVEDFEQKTGIQLPKDIAAMLTPS